MMVSQKCPEASLNKAVYDPLVQQLFQTYCIKLIAPASGLSIDLIEQLKQLPGIDLHVPADLITHDVIFHASSDENRFQQLKSALYDDSTSSILWTLRGGYGSARLLDKLSELPTPAQEKTVIGFSDNTALHLFLTQVWGWQSIHGSGLAQLLNSAHDPDNFIRIAECILHRKAPQTLTNLHPLNHEAKQASTLTGHMQGGNLTLVESSLGTSWQVKTEGAVLFLEEIGEKGYRIDRSLTHLRQAGLFKKVSAVVFGECIAPDPDGVALALQRFAYDIKLPVFQTNQFGHGVTNYPIRYQSIARIMPLEHSEKHTLIMT